MTRFATATMECPAECREWLDAIAPDLHDRDCLPFAVFTYLLDVSALLPRMFRLFCEGSPTAAAAATPGFLRAVEAVEKSFPETRAGGPATVHLWAPYCGVRVKLHHCLILLLRFAETSPDISTAARRAFQERREASLCVIRREVQGLLDVVEAIAPSRGQYGDTSRGTPSWMDVLRVLWPLSIVARLATVPAGLREAAVRSLLVVRRCTGFQRVVPLHIEPVLVPPEIERSPGTDTTLEGVLDW